MANVAQERDQDVVSYKGFTGLRNDQDPERFSITDLEVADNVDIGKSGRISRRTGRTKITATATHSLWGDGGDIGLLVQGNQLRKLAPDFSTSILAAGLTLGLRMMYTKVDQRVYFLNGAQTGVLENGQIRSWGLGVPRTPTVSISVGNLPAGSYQYAVTYVRNDGQESGATMASYVAAPAGASLVFTLVPSANSSVVAQNIYVTEPNGEILYLALTVPNSVTSAAYANDTLELSYDLKTQFLSPAPTGHIAGYYRGRMFVGIGDILFYSEPYAYELFDLRKYIQLPGRVTLIAAMEEKEQTDAGINSGLFIGTDQTCGVLVGSSPEDFKYVPKTNYGAVLGALEYVDGSVLGDGAAGARMLPVWLTTDGVCMGLPQMDIKNITRSKYSFPASGEGAALLRSDFDRLIMVSNY